MKNIFLFISVILSINLPLLSQVSSSNIYVACHNSNNSSEGLEYWGLYVSEDLGNSWRHLGLKTVKSFKVLPLKQDKGKTIFLAAGNGVLKSTDYGKSWKITTGWDITEVVEIENDSVDENIIYIGTAYGFCKSTDKGETWQYKNNGLKYRFVDAILVNREDTNNLFAGTDRGLFVSYNKGESWNLCAFEGISVLVITQDPVEPKIIYLGTEDKGIYKSDDYGTTWKPVNKGLKHLTVYDIVVDKGENKRVYSAVFKGGIYYTETQGEKWEQSKLDNQSVLSIDIHPFNRRLLVCGTQTDGVYISKDGGINWKPTAFTQAQIYDLKILKVK